MAAATEDLKFDKIEDTHIPCLENTYIKNKQYRLRRRLGSGGYSIVYLAEDRKDNKNRVAIKCMLHDSAYRREHFAKEVTLHQAASDIAGVVPLLDYVIEDDLAFLVLEFIPGKDLFEVMVEQRLFSGRDDIIRSTFLQLLDTVDELHSKSIFHRDLKPENILCNVTPEAGFRVYITDFGLATDNEESQNFGIGSYYYMLPECLVGSHSSLLKSFSSRAADIWALGIILVNLLSAKNPWKVALKTDPTFASYTRDSRYLEEIFPFSRGTSILLDRIFARHGCDVRIADLRTRTLCIQSFYMTPEQVACAPKSVRFIAAEWMRGVPMHDFKEEDLTKMTLIDKITDAQLFEDEKAPLAPSPTTTDASENTEASVPPLVREKSTGSDGPSIITPETKAVRPVEEVPELPEEQDIGEVLIGAPERKQRFVYRLGNGSLMVTDKPNKRLEHFLDEVFEI